MSHSLENNITEKPKIFFENLDALRTVACFSVFASHSMLNTTLISLWNNDFYKRFIKFFSGGGNGVSFFFVLSGFLITYLILDEYKRTNKFSLYYFYLRRVLRIWPLYYFVVLFGFFIYPISKHLIGMDLVIPATLGYHLFFLSNFGIIYIQQNNLAVVQPMMVSITWSVGIEEQFYLVWPLLFLILLKYYYKYIFFLVIINTFIFRFSFKNDGAVMYFHSFSVMGDLALGGLCAYYAIYSAKFVDFWKNLPKIAIIIGYIIGFLLLAYNDYMSYFMPYNIIYYRFLTTCFFAFIILEQNYSQYSILKYKKLKILSYCGKYTYSMYMLHPIGIQVSIILYKSMHIDNTTSFLYGIIYVIIAFVSACIMSYISYHYYELYFLKLKDKFTYK